MLRGVWFVHRPEFGEVITCADLRFCFVFDEVDCGRGEFDVIPGIAELAEGDKCFMLELREDGCVGSGCGHVDREVLYVKVCGVRSLHGLPIRKTYTDTDWCCYFIGAVGVVA